MLYWQDSSPYLHRGSSVSFSHSDTSTKVWSYYPPWDEIRDCTRGAFNPSSVRRPKKGHAGINSRFTKVLLAFSQRAEWNSSTHIIEASSHQMPLTVSAVLDIIQNTDLGMKGFIFYYQFPRLLILSPINSSTCSSIDSTTANENLFHCWVPLKTILLLQAGPLPTLLIFIILLSHKLVILLVLLPYKGLMTEYTPSPLL